ncbi:MAG: hypothetical protein F6K17_41245, partial [Okeania sp. SIO3C4]|nr:hypothetical protein [Okeania sp. SIO3C4]
MVERPIKKAEWQARKAAEQAQGADSQDNDRERRGGRGDRPQNRKRDRDRRKGGRGKDEERKPSANPALMKGPRPGQKKEEPLPVEEPTIEATEVPTDALQETSDIATDTPEEDPA